MQTNYRTCHRSILVVTDVLFFVVVLLLFGHHSLRFTYKNTQKHTHTHTHTHYWIDWMAASTRIGSGGVQFPGPVVLDHEYSRCCLRTAFYWVPSWISVARSVRPRHGKRYYYYP